jgi:iron(III) transport system ATP-binding protein
VAAGTNKVRVGRVELECAGGVDGAQPGAAVTVAVRPEDVAVRDVATDTVNGFEAKIVDMEFLGSFFRASLTADGMERGRIIADLSTNDVRDLSLASGKDLAVAVPRERIRVFSTH